MKMEFFKLNVIVVAAIAVVHSDYKLLFDKYLHIIIFLCDILADHRQFEIHLWPYTILFMALYGMA